MKFNIFKKLLKNNDFVFCLCQDTGDEIFYTEYSCLELLVASLNDKVTNDPLHTSAKYDILEEVVEATGATFKYDHLSDSEKSKLEEILEDSRKITSISINYDVSLMLTYLKSAIKSIAPEFKASIDNPPNSLMIKEGMEIRCCKRPYKSVDKKMVDRKKGDRKNMPSYDIILMYEPQYQNLVESFKKNLNSMLGRESSTIIKK